MSTAEVAIEKLPLQSLVSINREEVDLAISTAKQYPRDLDIFVMTALAMTTKDPEFAAMCHYALPRAGKIIEGPSVRFAECLASSWGNLTVGARVAEEQANHVVAQGVAHDLQTNSRYQFEVKRRITDKDGNRYNTDMITTTGNAACAIALRNAILRVIPKAYWLPIYQDVLRTIGGKRNPKNAREKNEVAEKRDTAIAFLFTRWGITQEQVLKILKIEKITDIGADEIVTLRGLATALQDGEITVDQAVRQSKPIPSMPKPIRGRKPSRKAPKGKATASGGVLGDVEYIDPAKTLNCPECKCTSGVHLKKCSHFIDPNAKKPITRDQWHDLLSWCGEHKMDGTDAALVAGTLGHIGKLQELDVALLPAMYKALERRAK
jgi:hypothetical protein